MKIPLTRYRYKSGIFDEADRYKRTPSDGRDMIIINQENRIKELEAQVIELRNMIKEMKNANS